MKHSVVIATNEPICKSGIDITIISLERRFPRLANTTGVINAMTTTQLLALELFIYAFVTL